MARLIARGTIGIFYPLGVSGPVHKCRRLFFTGEFLGDPPVMWTVIDDGYHPIRIYYDNAPFRAVWELANDSVFFNGLTRIYEARWTNCEDGEFFGLLDLRHGAVK